MLSIEILVRNHLMFMRLQGNNIYDVNGIKDVEFLSQNTSRLLGSYVT